MGPGPGPSAPLPAHHTAACLLSLPFPKPGRGRRAVQWPRSRTHGEEILGQTAPEPVSLAPSQPTSSPVSHSPYKNEAAAIFIEGPKLKIGLEHNLKK